MSKLTPSIHLTTLIIYLSTTSPLLTDDPLNLLNSHFNENNEISATDAISVLFTLFTNKNASIAQNLYSKVENNEKLTDDESFDHLCYITIAHYIEMQEKGYFSKEEIRGMVDNNYIADAIGKFYRENEIEFDVDELEREIEGYDNAVEEDL